MFCLHFKQLIILVECFLSELYLVLFVIVDFLLYAVDLADGIRVKGKD